MCVEQQRAIRNRCYVFVDIDTLEHTSRLHEIISTAPPPPPAATAAEEAAKAEAIISKSIAVAKTEFTALKDMLETLVVPSKEPSRPRLFCTESIILSLGRTRLGDNHYRMSATGISLND